MTAPRFEFISQRRKISRLPTEAPGRPASSACMYTNILFYFLPVRLICTPQRIFSSFMFSIFRLRTHFDILCISSSIIYCGRTETFHLFWGACHYLTNQPPFAKPSRSLQEGSAKSSRSVSSRRLRGASKVPPRTLHGVLRALRGGCIYRRLHEDALEGSRGLLAGSVDELHVPTR